MSFKIRQSGASFIFEIVSLPTKWRSKLPHPIQPCHQRNAGCTIITLPTFFSDGNLTSLTIVVIVIIIVGVAILGILSFIIVRRHCEFCQPELAKEIPLLSPALSNGLGSVLYRRTLHQLCIKRFKN